MTRGKSASKAENRERVLAEREAPLRRRIADLERQVADMDRANLAQQAAHLETARNLRMHIAAGTSDELVAAQQRILDLETDLDRVHAVATRIQKHWRKAADRLLARLTAEHDGDRMAAIEELAEWTGAAPGTLVLNDDEHQMARKFGADGVRVMRRARRAGA